MSTFLRKLAADNRAAARAEEILGRPPRDEDEYAAALERAYSEQAAPAATGREEEVPFDPLRDVVSAHVLDGLVRADLEKAGKRLTDLSQDEFLELLAAKGATVYGKEGAR